MLSCDKYLLKNDVLKLLLEKGYKKKSVKEFLVFSDPCESIVYQKIDGEYFKLMTSTSGEEEKVRIGKRDYKKAKKVADTKSVKKELYFLEDAKIHNYFDFIVLETRSKDVLKEYKSYLSKELYEPKKFNKKYILLYSKHLKNNTNIYNIFKKMTNIDKIDITEHIKDDMPMDEAIRIKLYHLYVKLSHDRDALINKHKNNSLKSFRRSLRSILSLLDEYSNYFDSELTEKVTKNLRYLERRTRVENLIYTIKSNLGLYKKCFDDETYHEFILEKDRDISQRKEELLYFLESREYAIILSQFETMIKEQLHYDAKSFISIKTSVDTKNSIVSLYKSLKTEVDIYLECPSTTTLIDMLEKLKVLDSINSEFNFLWDVEKFFNRKRVIKRLENKIEELLTVRYSVDIVKGFEKDKEQLDCILQEYDKISAVISKKIKKASKKLKKSKKLFVS